MLKKTFILLSLAIISCKNQYAEFEQASYKSTDETTGGFNHFKLNLHQKNKLELRITTSRATSNSGGQTMWESIQKNYLGKWEYQNDSIHYSFNQSKHTIDSIFIDSDFSNFTKKRTLKFSKNLDTAYVYGIPCIRETD